MTHWAENNRRLHIRYDTINSKNELANKTEDLTDVCLIILPVSDKQENKLRRKEIGELLSNLPDQFGPNATMILLGDTIGLVSVHTLLAASLHYQHWISIKRPSIKVIDGAKTLPLHHFGALVYTKYKTSLRHIKIRIQYTYCPTCQKTTKDYGGKKHTYHKYGTLVSDVWRDIACNPEGDLTDVINRFADIFSIPKYENLRVFDCRKLDLERNSISLTDFSKGLEENIHQLNDSQVNQLMFGDCLEKLHQIPDNSVDFAFADPPYNLGKHYTGYTDDMTVTQYFEWCDRWIAQLARVLRPGRTCAVLNIPLWAIRHFVYMETIMTFQNWITWDALAYPVRLIMPAHYVILCFAKGNPRPLPGLVRETEVTAGLGRINNHKFLEPLAEGFCLRAGCVAMRKQMGIDDRGPLTDLWWDIHRLKHNSRRVDHPCQLPPNLMFRLVSLFTQPGEVVLDCFNGAGTTTLTAAKLGRKYIGIEKSENYHNMASARHFEVLNGIDPFRKVNRALTAKNSPVPRRPKQRYVVPKKVLQLEVKRIASILGRLPRREEVIQHGKYPIEYYDQYFASWGEVCAAARTTGMSENLMVAPSQKDTRQPTLFKLEEVASAK